MSTYLLASKKKLKQKRREREVGLYTSIKLVLCTLTCYQLPIIIVVQHIYHNLVYKKTITRERPEHARVTTNTIVLYYVCTAFNLLYLMCTTI